MSCSSDESGIYKMHIFELWMFTLVFLFPNSVIRCIKLVKFVLR